jgi:hypothetical protein
MRLIDGQIIGWSHFSQSEKQVTTGNSPKIVIYQLISLIGNTSSGNQDIKTVNLTCHPAALTISKLHLPPFDAISIDRTGEDSDK